VIKNKKNTLNEYAKIMPTTVFICPEKQHQIEPRLK